MAAAKFQEAAEVCELRRYQGDYFLLRLAAPRIASTAQPGQFVDLLLPNAPHLLLRRPFSIFDTDPAAGTVALVFKTVGAGTRAMAEFRVGQPVSLLGPLGHGFPAPAAGQRLVIVAGGYGCAATYLIAKQYGASHGGVVLIGGRSAGDILVEQEFRATGLDFQVATNDGSRGHAGYVTGLLPAALTGDRPPAVYACGPNAMLKAVGELCLARQIDAYLSVDMPMCCGVGACFTCVIRLKAATPDGYEYTRTCKDGPVFPASRILWDD